jgi:hypothetical protein
VRLWIPLGLPLFVFFDVVFICGRQPWALQPSFQFMLLEMVGALSGLGLAMIYVAFFILGGLKRSGVTATDDGLVGYVFLQERRLRWDEARVWSVSTSRGFLFGRERTYTLWRERAPTGERWPALVWTEYPHLPLAGVGGLWRGRARYRERARLLNAVIAARTGLPLREEEM